MKNHREIYEALLAGEVVVDIYGNEIRMDDEGFVTPSIWKFVYPQDWSIKPKPKKVKYLKSMKQILEEFPYATFNCDGDLYLNDDKTMGFYIYHFYLNELGQSLEESTRHWPEYLIEEREEEV